MSFYRSFFYFLILMTVFFASGNFSSVKAQSKLSPCNEEELMATHATIQSVLDTVPPVDENITYDNVFELTLLFNNLSVDYWTTIFPTIPLCAESQVLAYQMGQVLDHNLMGVMLVHTLINGSERGEDEVAGSFVDIIFTHFDIADQQAAAVQAILADQEDGTAVVEVTAETELGHVVTVTADPPTANGVTPRSGEWGGTGYWGFVKLDITFTVDDGGNIIDVVVNAKDDAFGIDCHWEAEDVPLNSDGSLVLNIATNDSEGQVSELIGIFESETLLKGSASQFFVCGDVVMEWFSSDALEDGTFGSWSARPQ